MGSEVFHFDGQAAGILFAMEEMQGELAQQGAVGQGPGMPQTGAVFAEGGLAPRAHGVDAQDGTATREAGGYRGGFADDDGALFDPPVAAASFPKIRV